MFTATIKSHSTMPDIEYKDFKSKVILASEKIHTGPVLHIYEICPDVTKQLLACVEDQIIKRPGKRSEDEVIYTVGASLKKLERDATQANSIHGKIAAIDPDFQKNYHNNIIEEVIIHLSNVYVANLDKHTRSDNKKIEIQSAWYVFMEPGDFHVTHTHANVDISGAIYLDSQLDINKQPEGCIEFTIPQRELSCFVEENGNAHWQYCPQSCSAVVWPGYLPHSVYPFRQNMTRKMISFNCYLVDKATSEDAVS